MSGKCRPSLRKKTLENVKRSNLSNTDKECIAEVFERYEIGIVEVVRCKDCWRFVNDKEAFTTYCRRGRQNAYVKPGDFCSYGEKALKEREKE